MDHYGQTTPLGAEVGRDRDITSETHDDVRSDPVDDLEGGTQGGPHSRRCREQVSIECTWKRNSRHEFEWQPSFWDDSSLKTALGPQRCN